MNVREGGWRRVKEDVEGRGRVSEVSEGEGERLGEGDGGWGRLRAGECE